MKGPIILQIAVKNCEMSANAMAVFAHCFPRLRRVELTNVDFSAKNYAAFRCTRLTYKSEEETLKEYAKQCARKGIDFQEAMHKWVPRNGVEYTSPHPAPSLEYFYVNNHSSEYKELNLSLLACWFTPHCATQNLRSLELSAGVDFFSIAYFISEMGPSPVLEHLTLWVGCDVGACKSFIYRVHWL